MFGLEQDTRPVLRILVNLGCTLLSDFTYSLFRYVLTTCCVATYNHSSITGSVGLYHRRSYCYGPAASTPVDAYSTQFTLRCFSIVSEPSLPGGLAADCPRHYPVGVPAIQRVLQYLRLFLVIETQMLLLVLLVFEAW